jgi:nitrogen fixation protein FixH
MSAAPRRSSYIPWLFVAAFAIVIAVNGVMIWFAVGSFSGLYADSAREQGLHYNEVVAEQRARDALGWKVDAAWHAGSRRIEVALHRADGSALSGASVVAALVRPAEKRAALPLAMGDLGDGQYAGYVSLPERGNWDLEIEIAADGHRYGFTRRMFLK